MVIVETMPRRNRPNRAPRGRSPAQPSPLGASMGWQRTESGPEGDWLVRDVSGQRATKTYRCPGCDHEIRPGVPHIVAWPADAGTVEQRRHWHTGCWRARGRRGPKWNYD